MAESIFWFRGFHRGATDAGTLARPLTSPLPPRDHLASLILSSSFAGSLAFHSACFCRLSVMLAYNVNLLVIPPEQARAPPHRHPAAAAVAAAATAAPAASFAAR